MKEKGGMMAGTQHLERLSFDEMRRRYPDEWLLVRDCEFNEAMQLVRGIVVAHHPQRSIIHGQQLTMDGALAVVYSGEIAKDETYILWPAYPIRHGQIVAAHLRIDAGHELRRAREGVLQELLQPRVD